MLNVRQKLLRFPQTSVFIYNEEECIFNVSRFDLDFCLKLDFRVISKLVCLIVIVMNIAIVINS